MGYSEEMEFLDPGNAYEFILSLEDESCSGLCSSKLPLFYLAQDISLGAPTKECLVPEMSRARDLVDTVSIECLRISILMFTAIFWSFALCTGTSKELEEEE